MIAVTYTLTLHEPLLVTGLEGDPNTKTSLAYIPGSNMRGALIGRYLQSQQRSELSATDAKERRLFLDGTTRYLNAYPMRCCGCDESQSSPQPTSETDSDFHPDQRINDARTLPTPLTWNQQKGTKLDPGAAVHNVAIRGQHQPQNDPSAETPPIPWQPVSKPFCHMEGMHVWFNKPTRRISVHTARDPERGRSTAQSGAVFRYDALAPEQCFCGAILVKNEDDATEISKLLDVPELHLGGARSANYGRVEVVDVQIVPDWHEVPTPTSAQTNGGALQITCLSPCIVRNASGDFVAGITEALQAEIGVELALEASKTRSAVTAVGGFNRKWGLPLPQEQAIAAGSVFTFATNGALAASDLRTLQERGIGERRVDGFGRIALNWHMQEALTVGPTARADDEETKAAEKREGPRVTIDTSSIQAQSAAAILARRMGERILRQQLDRQLAEWVQTFSIVGSDEEGISNSQLSRLRVELRSAINRVLRKPDEADIAVQQIEKFLSTLKQPAQRQFERVRVQKAEKAQANGAKAQSEPLLNWIRVRLNSSNTLWFNHDKDTPAAEHNSQNDESTNNHGQPLLERPQPVSFTDPPLEPPDTWQAEYTLRLIDGVLAQATKQNQLTERDEV